MRMYEGWKPCSTSTPSLLLGRSRTCPFEARTSKPAPRYFPMVRAFAGDSTITRFFPPRGAGAFAAEVLGAALALGAALGLGTTAFAFAPDFDPVLRSVTISGRSAERPDRTGS